jgi:hypothetical protein
MTGYPPRRADVRQTLDDFVRQKQREVEALRHRAATVAQSIGTNFGLLSPDAGTGRVRPSASVPTPIPRSHGGPVARSIASGSSARAPKLSLFNIADAYEHSPDARGVAGEVARGAGLVPGAMRGAWHLARDATGGLISATRFLDPLDPFISPPGEAAFDQLFRGASSLAHNADDAIRDPQEAFDQVGTWMGDIGRRVNPQASPRAPTTSGEMARQFRIGMNQGETALDLGSLLYGGADIAGLTGIPKLTEAERLGNFANGYRPGLAEYFNQPLPRTSRGHHWIQNDDKFPRWLGGPAIPQALRQDSLFVLKPEEITIGDWEKRHTAVDRHRNGGKIPAEFGGGSWKARELGWPTYGRVGRAWYGASPQLKWTGAAGLAAAGSLVDAIWPDDPN